LVINDGPGRLLVAAGFFTFIGFVVAGVIVGLAAQDEYRRGGSRIHPLGWPAAGFLLLVLLALVHGRF